jgi:hypothetical protein
MKAPLALVLVAAAALAAPQVAEAASIGPDSFGYTAHDRAIGFVNISGTGTQVLANVDDQAVSAPIGFGFNFYGTSYGTAFISSNGLITFGAGDTTFTNGDLTLAGLPNPTIAALWDDWVTLDPAGAVYYETVGAPGSRQFIVQWDALTPFDGSGGDVTFEAILNEATGNILLNFVDTTAGGNHPSGGSATVGIRNTGAPGNGQVLQWSFNTQDASLRSGQAIEFSPAAVPEPGSLLLLGSGVAVVARRLRRRVSQN